MENFDQTPYHSNEVGSQNAPTLALVGSNEVPLVEGHSATRKRWTANLTTFSDKSRIERGEYPYAEFMCKADADGGKLELRLQEHCRSRGYGPWVTVAASSKGSYKEGDVLTFLERHLPDMSQSRRSGVIVSEDFGPHKTDNVWRLCWSRGYKMIPHGGGCTPVVQTADTSMSDVTN